MATLVVPTASALGSWPVPAAGGVWTLKARISGARTTLVGSAAFAIACSAAGAGVWHGTSGRSLGRLVVPDRVPGTSPAAVTLTILALAIVGFISNRVPLGIVAIGVSVALWFTGVLDLGQALSGFGDPTVVFIALPLRRQRGPRPDGHLSGSRPFKL
jgi:di/tricarboxylate transporter